MADARSVDNDVKTFKGRTLEEILPKIRAELGPDAIVLRRREGLAGGVGGFFQKTYVEVDARRPLDDEVELGARNDRATNEGLSTPAIQALIQQASPFADALARAEISAGDRAADVLLAAAAAAGHPVAEPAAPELDDIVMPAGLYGPQPRVITPEPETVAVEPETVAVEPETVAVEPETVAVEPETVAVEPETVAAEPELIAAEPLPEPVAPQPIAAEPELELVAEPVAPPVPSWPPAVVAPAPAPAPAPPPATWPPVAAAPAPVPTAWPPAAPAPIAAPAPTLEPAVDPVAVAAAAAEQRLVAAGLAPALAAEIAGAALEHTRPFAPDAPIEALVRTTLARRLHVMGAIPAGRRTIAVAGAGGAGKSTLVARLAGAYARADREVAVVALATRDGGAALAAELEPLGVTVIPAADAEQALRRLRHRTPAVCLVDLPALGARDHAAAAALAPELAALGATEVHLAVPATVSAVAADEIAQALAPLAITHMAITNVDQTARPGAVLELALRTGRPVSYLGSRDDVSLADAGALAAQLLP